MEKKGKRIVIAERDNIAVIMDGNKASEFFVNKGDVLLGDVYLANVQNILPSIDAAFVDVGIDKMGFLHAQDVMGKGALRDKLSPKQKLVVQVTKEPTGHKGPRVTTEISLPGRFLVLIPNETGINVSRKIESPKEKARLKSIVNLMKPVGVGVIVRTEAEGQTEADIQEDLEILLEKWNNIVTSGDSLEAPNLLYRDQDLLYRVLREACTDDISEILVDTAFAMNRVQQLLQNWHMSKNIKVNLYKGTEPMLVATDIHKEIKTALNSKVNMPSGGYLFIQQTEALTVIDVNSGKFVSSATQDETILKTNKEAVQEIARQLRLRNIGGMIIVDFIDMNSRVDKLAILEEFELALEPDKAKPQVGQLSDLGLVELTRHRQGQSLAELFTKKCPHCQGNGYTMEDMKFSSPTAEGEYRAKAAKMKLPVSNFKKNNENKKGKFDRKKNFEQDKEQDKDLKLQEQEVSVETTQEISEDSKPKKGKRRYNKKKGETPVTDEQMILGEVETSKEPEKSETPAPEVDADSKTEKEVKAEAEEKPKKTTRGRKKATTTKAKKIEASEEKTEEVKPAEVVEKEPEVKAEPAEEAPVKKTTRKSAPRKAKKAATKKAKEDSKDEVNQEASKDESKAE